MNDPKLQNRDRYLLLLLLAAQIGLVVFLVMGLVMSSVSSRPDAPNRPENMRQPPAGPSALDELAEVSRRVVSDSGRSVVHVEVRREGDRPRDEDELTRLFGTTRDWTVPPAQGSGIVVDAGGYILTNAHVVRDAQQITVHLPGGLVADAKLVGIDSITDLALLEVEGRNLAPVEWGDSDALSRGDFVWAVGSPFGLESSVSFGIVSATDRRLPSLPEVGLLQTDAAMNPGSSGGPLVDREGRVVGISTAIAGRDHQGVGFAIPARVARQVFLELLSSGSDPAGSGTTPPVQTPPARQDASQADGPQ